MSILEASLKLLLDEDISPEIANILTARGIDATCVRNRGYLEAKDHEVLDLAFREDRILVTANVRDFLKLAQSRELHCGIILIEDGNLRRIEQLEVIERVLSRVNAEEFEFVNRVVYIGKTSDMRVEDVPGDD